jgi:hypothetical protein
MYSRVKIVLCVYVDLEDWPFSQRLVVLSVRVVDRHSRESVLLELRYIICRFVEKQTCNYGRRHQPHTLVCLFRTAETWANLPSIRQENNPVLGIALAYYCLAISGALRYGVQSLHRADAGAPGLSPILGGIFSEALNLQRMYVQTYIYMDRHANSGQGSRRRLCTQSSSGIGLRLSTLMRTRERKPGSKPHHCVADTM